MGRLRFNKKAEEFLLQDQTYMLKNTNCNNFFDSDNPLFIEIGMGKGDFIINQAINNPNINFIGIEKYSTVTSIALKKAKLHNLSNLKLLNIDANNLNEIFKKSSIDKVFLNFSDPWPKKRHINRRLTSDKYLLIYKEILKPDGIVELKTDNNQLYNFTLENLNETKIKNNIIYYSEDIYSEIDNLYNINNIQTEYEKKFLSLGETIKKIIFKFK